MKLFMALSIITILCFYSFANGELNMEKIKNMIKQGKFTEAQKIIKSSLVNCQKAKIKKSLIYELKRMERILLDFTLTKEEAFNQAYKIYPITKKQFNKWEKEGYVEYMIIDNKKLYFKWAGNNLFRVCPEAKKLIKNDNLTDSVSILLNQNISKIKKEFKETKKNLLQPKNIKITYQIKLKPNQNLQDEVIRAWLPFPQQHKRQQNIKLINTYPQNYILSPANFDHSSIYFEQLYQDQPVEFLVEFTYTSYGFYNEYNPDIATNTYPDSLKKYTQEKFPHIQFTDIIKNLSEEIVQNEKNHFKIAKKIYLWISKNIVWAAAREYSTIRNIPEYAIKHKWGDCGIQTLLLITLCRYNNIPARWQTGWVAISNNSGMHDWAEIFIEPYGWIPVDPSYSDINLDFYFGNIDSYRLIINKDFSSRLYPMKTYIRSETVDFQRGEVEYAIDNLYFNLWNWKFKAEILNEN